MNRAERGAAAFHCGAPESERRGKTPNSAADVSLYRMWQSKQHSCRNMKTHVLMETQVDGGIWKMLGEEQVTARLSSLYFPQPIRTICGALPTPPKLGNACVPHAGATKLQQHRI